MIRKVKNENPDFVIIPTNEETNKTWKYKNGKPQYTWY